MTTGLRRDQIRGFELRAGEVDTAELADGAVTTAKIADGTILVGDFNASVYGTGTTTIDPDDTTSHGSSTALSRTDHQHQATAATAVDISGTSGEGNATTWARSNHDHGIDVPACRAVFTGPQTITTATDTPIQFAGTDSYDQGAMHDPVTNNTRFTAPIAGVYAVGGFETWSGASASGTRSLYVRVGGSTIVTRSRVAGATTPPMLNVQTDVLLAAAGYVEIIANQNSGADLDITDAGGWARYVTAG